jgi:hypothetical protein
MMRWIGKYSVRRAASDLLNNGDVKAECKLQIFLVTYQMFCYNGDNVCTESNTG